MDSIWRSTCPIPAFPSLRGDMETEIAVVGGGLCGLLTAYMLKSAGREVVVLEAQRILSGATQGTTAKITSQHGQIYDRLIHQKGIKKARQYAGAQQRAIEMYQALVRDLSIDCDFERKDAFLYSITLSEALERECRAAERLGLPASMTGAGGLPFPAAQALRFEDQAQFHPLKFGAALAARLDIREQARVTAISGHTLRTAAGDVRAKKIVVCTHFPIRNVPGFYFARMHQSRSYVAALENAQDVQGMWLDAGGNGYSFRNAGGLLLVGGEGHRTGEHPGVSCFQKLRGAAKAWYPSARIVARWAAQDCMPSDGVPFIGRYARTMPDVYVATGFQKWGMTNAMVAAELIADMVTGAREYPYADVFRPQRLSGVTPFIKFDVKSPRCAHMGCALEWNPDTRTLDCPCHGSSFSRAGRLINGPSTRDMDVEETNRPPSAT